jgi:hypothetical protein
MNQHVLVKMMDTSDLPTSVAVVLYLSIEYFTSRSLQVFHNKCSRSVLVVVVSYFLVGRQGTK